MTLSDSDSFVDVTKYGDNNNKQFRFGKEVWCNLEGRYMSIVADFTGVGNTWDTDYDIDLCHVAVMGTEYIRTGSLSSSVAMYSDEASITWTLNAITSKYTIGNTLNIELRQKAGYDASFVTITQGNPHTIVVAPTVTDTFHGYLYFESTDIDSNAATAAVLKTDLVQFTVLSPICRDTVPQISLAYTFNTVDEIEMIVEYEPKIYFPKNIWTGLHTQTAVSCHGTYTQTITMDKSVTGVTVYDYGSSPYLEISKTAPD